MKVVLALGTNTNYDNIQIAEERLSGLFSAVRVSRMVVSPAVNSPGEVPDFANAVMICDATATYDELRKAVKEIERKMGRKHTPEKGSVEMDIDILQYGDARYKLKDWERSYNVLLLKELGFIQ